jgi:hypothetical protein
MSACFCATSVICLQSPEVFYFTVQLRQPPYSTDDRCDPTRTGENAPLSKQWLMEGYLDGGNDCAVGFSATGLEGDKIVKLCGGDGSCLPRGSAISMGGETYTVLNSAIAPPPPGKCNSVKKPKPTILSAPSGCCPQVTPTPTPTPTSPSDCGCTDEIFCQIVELDRPLAEDLLNQPALMRSEETEQIPIRGDNMGNGLFRFRLNSANLKRGNAGILSLFFVQRYKQITIEKFYSGISLPVFVN